MYDHIDAKRNNTASTGVKAQRSNSQPAPRQTIWQAAEKVAGQVR
jgi:hypothetical protein